MIQRDYILRLIEEACQVLARVVALRGARDFSRAESLMDEEFQKLLGLGAAEIARLPDADLFARIVVGEPTQVVRQKCFLIVACLQEAAALYQDERKIEVAELCRLKALNLLLETRLRTEEGVEIPNFVPKVEDLIAALPGDLIPSATRAALIQHFERLQDYRRAVEELHALLEVEADNPRALRWAMLFLDRLQNLPDSTLAYGRLSRNELEQQGAKIRLEIENREL